ncbi:hypothetical protein HN51_057666 [Arachis hypogaea]|nr:(3S,6E)-nerolidol synthase 1 [Arachis ipaensis]XP_025684037.1 (3S,6E)-nerolidol synthase 1 [Arachis hypogaea]
MNHVIIQIKADPYHHNQLCAMALHYSKWCFPTSFKKPHYVATTKAHLSHANQWNILQQNPRTVFQDDISVNHAEKLMELKHALLRNSSSSSENNNSLQGMQMIDAMQRLNVDYHFQEEINSFLQRQYVVISSTFGHGGAFAHHHLHHLALCFRLFRQQGHFVPPEVFEKFRDKEGKFRQELLVGGGGDIVKGMMELYEASQISIKGEDMVDEAGEFSCKFLKERLAYLDNDDDEAKFVRSTIENPFHKSLPMFTARDFLRNFHGGMNSNNNNDDEWFGSLKALAKMDFTLLQRLHQQEIIQISKWWTKLGLANELQYARNQPLKWYIWSLACLSDPNFSEERIDLTKSISFIYIIDDIFDVYGTLDELTLFTDAVSRWDVTVADELPDYMRICFRVLYDLTNEISFKIYQKHGWDANNFLRNAWKRLCKAFLVEAKWFASGKSPSSEEYLKNGIISSGVHIVLVHIFFMLGEGLNSENVKIIDGIPDIISSSATILRLWDDLGNAEDENQEGNDGSYVDCLLMEDKGLARKEAREEVMNMINDAWKRLNQECFFESTFPKPFTKASLNLARMVPLMYTYDNHHSLPMLEPQVKSLLYDNSLFL